jgi:hypothetical protein
MPREPHDFAMDLVPREEVRASLQQFAFAEPPFRTGAPVEGTASRLILRRDALFLGRA